MAIKRMFAKSVIEDDPFLDLPVTSQILYVHLNMFADDDGFIGNIKRTINFLGISTEDDLKLLFAKGYLVSFPSGVVVIAHWKVHNSIRKDRHIPTIYQEELQMLKTNSVGKYYLDDSTEISLTTKCQPSVGHSVAIDKYSIEENSIDKDSNKRSLRTMYFDSEELNKTFIDFLDMRKKIRKPASDRAITMLINKLKKMSEGDEDLMIKILEQSILSSWQDVYELKEPYKRKQAPNRFKNFDERDVDYDALARELIR